MKRDTILIRADANAAIGTGHVMRCLALAQAWQDAGGSAVFAMASPSGSTRERLQRESIAIFEIPVSSEGEDAQQTAVLAHDQGADWMVVDGYQFGADYQRALKSANLKVLFLDDYGHASHYCADVVLNQNISADEMMYASREPYTRLLLGPQYCLLRREFNGWRDYVREIAPVAHRVLVTMGGSDPSNFTRLALDALNLVADDRLEAAVVVGGGNEQFAALESAAAASTKKINFGRDISNMAELMAWSDVAISAAGTTTWELCRLGLPALLIDLADNQTAVARELDRRGCAIHLGSPRDVASGKIAEQLAHLLQSPEERAQISSRCRQLVDGRGAGRVVSALRGIKLRLRPAQENDSRLLWEWANDEAARAASFSPAPIPWTTHIAWFAEKLQRKECRILIAEDGKGTPVGQIRIDVRPDGAGEIDVSLAKASRGQGLAAELIREAINWVSQFGHCARLHAFVKPENVASMKAFEKAGFHRAGTEQVRGNTAVHFVYEAS